MGSYLYVIGPDDQNVQDPWIKLGRSADPAMRRSQLQVGQGEKLKVWGMFAVPADQAGTREAAAKAFFAPIKIKGEVFRCTYEVGSAFAEQFATHGEADTFVRLLLASELADQEWNRRLEQRGRFRRQRVPEDLEEALSVAEHVMRRANDALFDHDFERAAKTDEIMGDIRRPAPPTPLLPPQQKVVEGKRILVPRQPRTGPSLFKRRSSGSPA
jgi:hypothetical protein